MVDPLLVALGGLAQEVTVGLALVVLERQWKHNHLRELTPRRTRRILDGAAESVTRTLRHELAGVPDNERRAALTAVHESLAAVMPFRVADAVAVELRRDRLEAHLRERAAPVRQAAALSEVGEAVYDRILSVTCQQILEALMRLPGFERLVQVQILQNVGDVRRLVDDLSGDRHPGGLTAPEFERRYLEHVVATLGRLELFGVGRGRGPRSHPFEQAYVDLAIVRSGGSLTGDEDDELTGAGVDVASGLRDHRRVLVRGGAGAGKTTLLRWLAVTSVRQGGTAGPATGAAGAISATNAISDGDTVDTGAAEAVGGPIVPFFVPLRQFAHGDLPTPEQLPAAVAEVITAEMPPGWVSAQLRAGRALLLVDGVDELEPGRRLAAREWLGQLVTAYPEARVVVSARPFAIPEDWLAASGFVTFDLQPLSPEGIDTFVSRWHDAARDEHPTAPEVQRWLDECEQGLREQLRARVELRRLAGTPLLCGLLCALYQDRNMHLPRDRRGLYDAALDLLLVRWDEERGVRVTEWPALSKEEQIVLLQRFAYTMVKNHEVVIPRDDAAQRITHAMRGLRSQDLGAEPVLQRTLERTGLLREPSPDQVQFVHRTFRDHLAAKEVVDAGELSFLAEQAHLDHWHDVVVNAVAHARPHERDQFLRKLLDGNTAAAHDARLRSRLHLVAAACLPQAEVLDSGEVRQLVQGAAARLIPPTTLDEADVLARAGKFVLDLLPGPDGLTADQAACVVRTAAMIGGQGVREKLAEFVTVGESRVIDELLRAWRRSDDPDGYAATVLADVDFGGRRLEVRGWHRVRCLARLRHLTDVVCYGDFADLRPVAAVPQLRRLELVQNEMVRDLSPLAASTTLRTLRLSTGFQFLEDLSPLATTTVEELSLHLVGPDLGTLRSPRLRRLVIRDRRIGDGLHPLPADLPLQELVVANLPRSRNLLGVERWRRLEHVSVRGIPRPDEVEALAELPDLRRLTIHDPETGGDLSHLTVLDAKLELVTATTLAA